MSYYDDIYDLAVDNHYLITTQSAAQAGIPGIELAKLAHRGKLTNICRGLYRLDKWIPDETYSFAEAVARLGENAHLYGESVVALLGLAPTNPSNIYVATPNRVRKKLPRTIKLKKARRDETGTMYFGIPCQKVADAIVSARSSMPNDRLLDAAVKAEEEGYIRTSEFNKLKQDMGWE